jgi:TolB protein
LQPITASAGGPVFTGVAGGAFSSIVLNPAQDIDSTTILFGRGDLTFAIDADGQNERLVNIGTFVGTATPQPSWSPDGSKFVSQQEINGIIQLIVANADGSRATVISSGTTSEASPAWSPAGDKIAFYRFDSTSGFTQIYTRNTDGSGIARISDRTASDSIPAWSPDGSKIAFERIVSGVPQIYVMDSSGHNAHPLTTFYPAANMVEPAWSPDGTAIAFVLSDASSDSLMLISLDGLHPKLVINDASNNMAFPAWSPDGKSLVFIRFTNPAQFIVTDTAHAHERVLATQTNTAPVSRPTWSPFPPKKTIVGTSGFLGTAAAGFIYGQDGFRITGVVAFNATTPDATTVATSDNVPGASNVVFTVSGALNSIKYYNTGSPATAVLPSGSTTSATGALVSFDVQTGTIASIIPFTAARSTSPKVVSNGNGRIYQGTFLGIFGPDGVNTAPGGATEIRVEPKTGVARKQ